MGPVSAAELRSRLAVELSEMYADEVPVYRTLLETCDRLNRIETAASAAEAERVGAERHGAVRFGSTAEIAQFGRLLRLFGMFPVGLYDLRDTASSSLPIVATAFRPTDPDQLQLNPFRLFTSVLVPADRRFFKREIQTEIEAHVGRRDLIGEDLAAIVERSGNGVAERDAADLVGLTVEALALSADPIEAEWHAALNEISPVAADIAAPASTHLNHLTPRVFDIDALYAEMQQQDVQMINRIQGPPPWDGPDLLLRQTSFRAMDERRTMRLPDGSTETGHVRVRFGEVEQRGAALTPKGRGVVDRALAAKLPLGCTEFERAALLAQRLNAALPAEISELARASYIYVRQVSAFDAGPKEIEPITYEDFLPASAAGIFESNLDHAGTRNIGTGGAGDAVGDLNAALGGVADPYRLYASQQAASFA